MDDEIYDITDKDFINESYLNENQKDQKDRIDIKEVIGKEIVVYKCDIKDSQYHEGEYAIIDIDLEGDTGGHEKTLITSSKVLLDQLERYASIMPFRAIIEQKKGNKWKYYSFKPVK